MDKANMGVMPEQQTRLNWKQLVAAGAVVGGMMLAGCSGDSSESSTDSTLSAADRAVEVDQACDTAKFAELSNNADQYVQEAFLPKTDKLDSNEDVESYLNTIFNAGPLGTEIDETSAAAIQAAIVVAANDGQVKLDGYNYVQTFADKVAAYRAPGGLEAAQTDCSTAYATLVQTGEYNANWAQAGETVTEIQTIRNDAYETIGMNLVQGATLDTLSGAEFKLRESSKEIDGFNEVLITKDGRMFVKGVSSASIEIADGQPVEMSPEDTAEGIAASADSDSADSNNADEANNGGGTFGESNGDGESNQPGHVPESGGNGGYTPDTTPSYGPGTTQPGGGGEGGPTPTTKPQKPTTTTTPPTTRPPQTTTTTRPYVPPTTTTTTRPPVKPPIVGCDPEFEVCE